MLPSLYTIYIFIIIFFATKTTNGTIRFGLKKRTIHEGRKDYECDICNQKFSSSRGLKIHKIGKHNATKPFDDDY